MRAAAAFFALAALAAVATAAAVVVDPSRTADARRSRLDSVRLAKLAARAISSARLVKVDEQLRSAGRQSGNPIIIPLDNNGTDTGGGGTGGDAGAGTGAGTGTGDQGNQGGDTGGGDTGNTGGGDTGNTDGNTGGGFVGGTGGTGGGGGTTAPGTTVTTGADDEDEPEASPEVAGRGAASEDDDGGGSNTGKIVAGILGGLAGLALLGALAFLLFRRRGDKSSDTPLPTSGPDVESPEARGVEIEGSPDVDGTGVGADFVADEAANAGPAVGAAAAGAAGAAALAASSHSDSEEEDDGTPVPPPVEEVADDAPHDYVVGHGPTKTNKEFDDAKDKFDHADEGVGIGSYNRMGPAPAYAGSAASGGARFGGPRGAIFAASPDKERARPTGEIARETGDKFDRNTVYADMKDGDYATYEGAEAVGDGSGLVGDAAAENPSSDQVVEEVAEATEVRDLRDDGADL